MDLKAAIQIIESGAFFSATIIQANIAKGTGGKVLEVPKAKIARTPKGKPSLSTGARSANHAANFTRNIELYPSRRVLTIHPILITHINNHPVV